MQCCCFFFFTSRRPPKAESKAWGAGAGRVSFDVVAVYIRAMGGWASFLLLAFGLIATEVSLMTHRGLRACSHAHQAATCS